MKSTDVLVWVVGIMSSIIGAAIWGAGAHIVSARTSRRGALSGYFYQVTYDPDNRGTVWSIELAEVKHSKDGRRLVGTWWRIYDRHLDRVWHFEARYSRDRIRGLYWNTQGAGSEGLFKLKHVNDSYLFGKFEAEDVRQGEDYETSEEADFRAPMEWRRVEPSVHPVVLEMLRSSLNVKALPGHIPNRAKKVISRSIRGMSRSQEVLESLAYGSALLDNQGPLAVVSEQRRREQWLKLERELGPVDLTIEGDRDSGRETIAHPDKEKE